MYAMTTITGNDYDYYLTAESQIKYTKAHNGE